MPALATGGQPDRLRRMFPLIAILLLSLQTPNPPAQDLASRLCPDRYTQESEGWSVQLDHKWIVVDQAGLTVLDAAAASKEANPYPGTQDLLGHLAEFHTWQRLPRFVPRQKLESLTPIGAFGVRVDTNMSGSYTREGLKKHQNKIAESVRNSAAFFNREGESERIEDELVKIHGARTLRVLVSTIFPDKGSYILESWTLPGGDRYFTVSMLYPKAYREICARTIRSFLGGFEGIQEVEGPGSGQELELGWGLILVFLLPFLVLPILFFRRYKRPAPPQA